MKLKRLVSVLLAVAMVGYNLGGLISVKAIDGDGPTVKNDPNGPTVLDDGVRLHKTARAVPGFANEWEVTLKIEAPVVTATSDTVIVIDRSNSMNNGPLDEAKDAAETLVDELLNENNIIGGNPINRVAVVSYGSNFSNESNGFTGMHDVAYNAIDNIDEGGGGTFTQGGLHMAIDLLNSSSATYKNIILLSDGEPTYSFRINNPDNYLIDGGPDGYAGWNKRQTSTEVSASDFVYTGYNNNRRVGDGSSMWTYYDYSYSNDWIHFYNHGNSAIAEAGFFNGKGNLYAIYFETDSTNTLGEDTLRSMATAAGGEMHTATAGELDDVFEHIAGKISSVVNSAHVHDVMGEGVYVDNATHAEDLDWDPVFTLNTETNMYEATRTYRVSANEAMLEDSAHETEEGFHRLNKFASISYGDDKTGDFPVPYVKPFYINVTKELVGQEANGQVFNFEFTHPDNTKSTYSVKAGETHSIMEPFPVGSYTVNETGTSNNTIAFENYLIDYEVEGESGNTFQINEEHSDHIDITMTNTYETVDMSAEKEWDDDDDRDGKRSNYSDLAVAVKDGDKYVAYEALDLTGDKSYSFEGLPKNRNGSEIGYTIVEARGCSGSGDAITCRSDFVSDGDYEATVTNGVITNKHVPDTVTLTIKKKWDTSAGTLPTVTPGFVTIEVSNDKNDTVETVTLQGESYTEWTGTFTGLKNEAGQEINYTVAEKKIGDDALNANNTLYVYNGDVLEGKWVATREGVEVTNTWTPATNDIIYEGENEFTIEKVDEDYEALSGVVFNVSEETKTTDDNGQIKVEVPVTTTEEDGDDAEPEESFEYVISEKEAAPGYDAVEGSATVTVACASTLSVDVTTLVNTYTKTCEFAKEDGSDKFVWDGEELTLTVINKRSLAKSLVITKTFSGVNASVLKDVTFTIEGPEDFGDNGTMTLTVGEDCTSSEDKIVCEVDAKIPTGDYTVTESNAEIEFFTLNVTGDNGEEKTVEKDDEVEFEIDNEYIVETTYYDIVKIWEDEHNKDGSRPDTLTVNLLANGEVVDTVELSADNEIEDEDLPEELESSDIWVYPFEGLPVADENAEEIEYYAEEILDDVEGYEQIDEIGGMHTVIFVNMHEPVDPCEDEGGCGGTDTTPIETPETGRLVKSEKSGAVDSAWLNNMIGGGAALLAGALIIVFTSKRKKA